MGQTRKAPAKRAKRGGAGGDGRRAIANADARVDADAGLSAGERLDAQEDDAGLADAILGSADETNKRYRRLRLKAEHALSVLIDAPGVPANVRSAAIRTALELVGAIGGRSKEQREQEDADGIFDPERLTVEDIDREINKLGRV
jgi:hypothetical protein